MPRCNSSVSFVPSFVFPLQNFAVPSAASPGDLVEVFHSFPLWLGLDGARFPLRRRSKSHGPVSVVRVRSPAGSRREKGRGGSALVASRMWNGVVADCVVRNGDSPLPPRCGQGCGRAADGSPLLGRLMRTFAFRSPPGLPLDRPFFFALSDRASCRERPRRTRHRRRSPRRPRLQRQPALPPSRPRDLPCSVRSRRRMFSTSLAAVVPLVPLLRKRGLSRTGDRAEIAAMIAASSCRHCDGMNMHARNAPV